MATDETRRPIHIANLVGTHCAADGVALTGKDLPFTVHIGEWNQLKHRCVPDKIMTDSYTLIDRVPQSTSAIQHPTPPNRKTER